jgi:hypothetical protein
MHRWSFTNDEGERKVQMKTHTVRIILVVVSMASIVGCAEFSHKIPQGQRKLQEIPVMPQGITNLAGLWEYTDKTGSYPITLNAEGKGPYEWKEGRFETISLQEGIWTGIWIQEGNDREGGFELTFPGNADAAEGEWWYTRIGKNHDPLEPGGHFTMTRPSVIPLHNKSK